jgi:hypothetical protein
LPPPRRVPRPARPRHLAWPSPVGAVADAAGRIGIEDVMRVACSFKRQGASSVA